MKKRNRRDLRQLLSMLLALVLTFSTAGTTFAVDSSDELPEAAFSPEEIADPYAIQPMHAEEGDDDSDHEHDDTPYGIRIYGEALCEELGREELADANKHVTITYTVTSHDTDEVSEVYDVNDKGITALAGDTITMYLSIEDGYELSSSGYVKQGRENSTFNLTDPTCNADIVTVKTGKEYTFEMPQNNITLGAAVYEAGSAYVTKGCATSNNVANTKSHGYKKNLSAPVQTQHWVYEDDEYILADVKLNTAVFDLEGIELHMEARAVSVEGAGGYREIGVLEKTKEEWLEMIEGLEPTSPGGTTYLLEDVQIPLGNGSHANDPDKRLTDEDTIYVTIQTTKEDWVNATGAPAYLWTYCSNRTFVLPAGAEMPEPMVFLYNMGPETYFGELVAREVEMVSEETGVDIEVVHIDETNLNESVGYLAGWPGYSPSEDPSGTLENANRYLVYANLDYYTADLLTDRVNRTQCLSTNNKMTHLTAGQTFAENFGHQDEESEVFGAAMSLALNASKADAQITEEKYGDHELWDDFRALIEELKVVVKAAEGSYTADEYNAYNTQLLEMQYAIQNKTLFNVELEFVIEEYDDENYLVSVKSEDPAMEESDWDNVTYYWSYCDSPSDKTQIVPKDELYRIQCTVGNKNTSRYSGYHTLRMSPPTAPEYDIDTTWRSITVDFEESTYPTKGSNHAYTQYYRPETTAYIARLLDADGNLIDEQMRETAGELTFRGLDQRTDYIVKVYTENIVGRTDIVTEEVTTSKKPSSDDDDSSSSSSSANKNEAEKDAVGESDLPFTDIDENDACYDAAAFMYENGLMAGTGDGTKFSPEMSLSRAMTARIFHSLEKNPAAQASAFSDVTRGLWYTDAIDWAAANGVIAGYGNGKFGPNDNVTREQLAVMLYLYAQNKGYDVDPGNALTQPDARGISFWAIDAVQWAVNNGILTANGVGYLAAGDAATRADVANAFMAMLQLYN